MSFLNTVGHILIKTADLLVMAINAFSSYGDQASEKVQNYRSEMKDKSDAELAKTIYKDYKASKYLRASVAKEELKNRGYSEQEIKSELADHFKE